MTKKKINKIIMSTTLLNFLPTLLTGCFWLFLVIIGIVFIKAEFGEHEMYTLFIMIWLVLALSLSRIVLNPIQTYSEEEIK